jgi:hypothetical protein
MNIFSIDITIPEIQLLRSSLDVITVSGKDAKFVAGLQIKLEQEMQSIQQMIAEAEEKKKKDLEQVMAQEARRAAKEAAKQAQ